MRPSTAVTLNHIRVKVAMAEQEISCADLAQKAGVGKKIIVKARHDQPISLKFAEKVAKALNADVYDLIESDPNEVTYL